MSDVIQYMVRDPQGNMYGPATMATISQWVREGRITALMNLAPEGSLDWMPAASYPELQNLFTPEQIAAATGGPVPGGTTPQAPQTPTYATYTGPAPVYTPTMQAPKTNGLAIASLVCACVGLCCCLGGLLGIIFGVIAKNQIKKSQGMQTGEGLATAGIIVGIITLVISLGLGILNVVLQGNAGKF